MIIIDQKYEDYEHLDYYESLKRALGTIAGRIGFDSSLSLVINLMLEGLIISKEACEPSDFIQMTDRILLEITTLRRGVQD